MYSSATGDIHGSHLVEEAVLAPDPVRRNAVDDRVHQGKEAVRIEVAPVEEKQVLSYKIPDVTFFSKA